MKMAYIAGIGIGLPKKVLTNADLEKMVDTSDEWITTRTGIKERRILEEGRSATDICAEAGKIALDDAGMHAEELDMVIVATFTPDMHMPATACLVQHELGATNAAGFDLNAACSGYLYALSVADGMIRSGQADTVLVIGCDIVSRFTNWEDRGTCVLFGDGAGATILKASEDNANRGVLASFLKSDGALSDILSIPAGGSKEPITKEGIDAKRHLVQMRGNEVFKIAVRSMDMAVRKVLEKAGITIDDVDLVITHQANLRIITALAKRLKVPDEKVFITIHKYGNTSAGTIPMAMYDAKKEGKIKEGTLAVFAAFGGGLTWGASLVRF